jgi:hypothetical protein
MTMEVGSGTPNGHGIIKVFGGSHTNSGQFFLGTRANTTGDFFVGGGTWTILSTWNVGEPNAVGRITVTNGLLQVPVVQIPIFLGHGAGGYGELNVAGGTVSLGDWGTPTGPRIVVGAAANATGFVHVTSGTLQLLNEGGGGLIVGTNAFSSGLVVLDGGLTQLRRLNVGSNGILSNRTGAVLQWLVDPSLGQVPGVTGSGTKIMDGGTLSYKGFSAVDVVNAASQFSIVSGSILQLDSSTNANITGTYFVTNAANSFKELSVTGTGARWQSDSLDIAAGASLHVTNAVNARFASAITNKGTVLVQGSTVTYEKPVTVSGLYISDPSTNTFNTDLTVSLSGALTGGPGDLFDFKKNLIVNSTNNPLFDLASSTVKFSGGGNHTNAVTGGDFGTNGFASVGNFGYGKLSLGSSADQLYFISGGSSNGSSSNALCVLDMDLLGNTNLVSNLHSSFNIYYMLSQNEPFNAYLQDKTYSLQGGGFLMPAIPEPSVLALLVGAGVILIVRTGGRRSNAHAETESPRQW